MLYAIIEVHLPSFTLALLVLGIVGRYGPCIAASVSLSAAVAWLGFAFGLALLTSR